ncbi:DUF3261 domain-containing protein [Radicibacter daui]|uniref:DUF3261 domain-containing protein n=1 Tax=Radicibacter daui TaxID=3064829 RepID=UPI004046FBEF
MRHYACLILAALLMSGCAASHPSASGTTAVPAATTAVSTRIELQPGLALELPREPWPASAGTVDVEQQIVATAPDGSTNEFAARLAMKPGDVHIVMLDGLGRRAIDAHWTASSLEVNAADWLPRQVDPRRALADVLLVYWPQDVLKQALPQTAELLELEGGRAILDRQTGKPLVEINRPQPDQWQGAASLANLDLGYSLTIQSRKLGE